MENQLSFLHWLHILGGESPNQTYIYVSDVNEPNDDGSVPDIWLEYKYLHKQHEP